MSDRGGGLPHKLVSRVFDYNFTTSGTPGPGQKVDIFDGVMGGPQSASAPGRMHGYVAGPMILWF